MAHKMFSRASKTIIGQRCYWLKTKNWREREPQKGTGTNWYSHNGAQQTLCTYYTFKCIPPLLCCPIRRYKNHQSHWGSGLKSLKPDLFRRHSALGELPQFSAGVSFAAAAAKRGQVQGSQSKYAGIACYMFQSCSSLVGNRQHIS